jgi:hypothetical protein
MTCKNYFQIKGVSIPAGYGSDATRLEYVESIVLGLVPIYGHVDLSLVG